MTTAASGYLQQRRPHRSPCERHWFGTRPSRAGHRGRGCPSAGAMQHSRGRRRAYRLIGSAASRDPERCKHKRRAVSALVPSLLVWCQWRHDLGTDPADEHFPNRTAWVTARRAGRVADHVDVGALRLDASGSHGEVVIAPHQQRPQDRRGCSGLAFAPMRAHRRCDRPTGVGPRYERTANKRHSSGIPFRCSSRGLRRPAPSRRRGL